MLDGKKVGRFVFLACAALMLALPAANTSAVTPGKQSLPSPHEFARAQAGAEHNANLPGTEFAPSGVKALKPNETLSRDRSGAGGSARALPAEQQSGVVLSSRRQSPADYAQTHFEHFHSSLGCRAPPMVSLL